MSHLPVISILMPSYNQGTYIEKSVLSVLSQKYPHLEFIVIDGKSSDRTLEVLKQFGSDLRVISEKDNGQADALKKGIQIAKGEIVGWLNSDDIYLPGTLLKIGEFFANHPDKMWVFGHSQIIDGDGHEIRKWISYYKAERLRRYSYQSLLTENYISQMSVFMRRNALIEVGGINASYHYAMDYDLWLRLAKKYDPGFIDSVLAAFRRYETTKSVTSFVKQFAEDYEVARKHAGNFNLPILFHFLNNLKIVTIYQMMSLSQKIFGKKRV